MLFSMLFTRLSCGNGKCVTALVIGMSRMTLDPYRLHLMPLHQPEQPLPQIGIQCRLAVRLLPSACTPADRPAILQRVYQIF